MKLQLTYNSTIWTFQRHMHLNSHAPANLDSMDVNMHMSCIYLLGQNNDLWIYKNMIVDARVDRYTIKKKFSDWLHTRIFYLMMKNTAHKKVEAKIDANLLTGNVKEMHKLGKKSKRKL